MNPYQKIITETVGCTPEDAVEIEDYMRHVYFESTLSSKTREQIQQAARESWGDIQYMRTPEGQAYMQTLS